MPSDAVHLDRITIAELYEQYAGGLKHFAINLSRDGDKADDLVSETFMQAMAYLALLGTLKPYQRKAWLYKVLKNRFIDQVRVDQRRQKIFEQMAWMEVFAVPALPGQDLFAQIPARFKDLLHMSYVLGMTSEEIGQKLGVPAATVRSRLHLAIQWLRDHASDFR